MIFEYGGTSHTVSVEAQADGSTRVMLDGRALTVTARRFDGGWLLTLAGRQVRVYTAARGNERYAALAGDSFTLTVPESAQGAAGRGTGARRTGAVDGSLTAQMPGQVREVLVQAGETVTRGQTLLLLEAMKMEIRVTAPADGLVNQVLVDAGAVVDRGQVLVELGGAD